MGSCYASLSATCVLLQKVIPARPPAYDGGVILRHLPSDVSEEALRCAISANGSSVVSVELSASRCEARVTYASHADAEEAVATQPFRGDPLLRDAEGVLSFNETPYEAEGARSVGRGSVSRAPTCIASHRSAQCSF